MVKASVAEILNILQILKKIVPSILLGAIFCGFCVLTKVKDPAPIAYLRGSGFDQLQRIWPRQSNTSNLVTIIDIDEASLKTRGQWPWPRTDMAKLVDEIAAMGASAIAFDIVFPEPDRLGQSNDVAFAQSIKEKPVVLAFASSQGVLSNAPKLKAGFAQTGNSATNAPPKLSQLTQNIAMLDDVAAGIGSMNIDLAENQGITRQIPLLITDGQNLFPSLSLEALRVAQGADTFVVNSSAETTDAIESIRIGDFEIPTADDGQFKVYFRTYKATETISAARVISGNERENITPQIQGHIVLIGTSAVGLLDMRSSTLGEAIPGVAVHAQALEQILQNQFLSRPQYLESLELWLVALFGLSIAFCSAVLRPLKNIAFTCSLLCTLAATTAFSFTQLGLLVDFTWPFLTLLGTYLVTTAYRLMITDRDGRKLRHAFSHYVAPTILAEIEKNPAALKLGGAHRDVTVMFVDIENFTPIAETLSPEKLVGLVNEVLQICSTCILAEGGTIDKFIGDAVMAFWNAPLPKPDHQYYACRAALTIQAKLENYTFENLPVKVRIGIASGPAIVGNMGSMDRFNYSVMGETVNTAARAEQACKQVHHNIVLAGEISDKTKTLTTLPAGQLVMKGISSRTKAHIIIGHEAFAQRELLLQTISSNKAACQKRAEQFPALADYFNAIPARAQDFMQ
jgi:adenylate cyclase